VPQYELNVQLPFGLHPATVVVVDEDLSVNSVKNTLQRFQETDDVFDSNFLGLVIFCCPPGITCELSGQLATFLGSLGTLRVGFVEGAPPKNHEALSEGPSSLGLHRVWRLVPDTYGAFVASLVETVSQK
jgi:hypothetical protein